MGCGTLKSTETVDSLKNKPKEEKKNEENKQKNDENKPKNEENKSKNEEKPPETKQQEVNQEVVKEDEEEQEGSLTLNLKNRMAAKNKKVE